MRFTRSSGILLHITSLPSKFGIGDFGPKAYEFVNFHKRLNSGKIGFGSVCKNDLSDDNSVKTRRVERALRQVLNDPGFVCSVQI